MPYRIDPKNPKVVQHKKGDRWTKKQTCSSPAKAKAAIRYLNMIDHPKKGK